MFNKKLRLLRMENKKTQQNMADALGIALNTYQKYEQGAREPSLAMLVALAKILGVTTDSLLCFDESRAKPFDEFQ